MAGSSNRGWMYQRTMPMGVTSRAAVSPSTTALELAMRSRSASRMRIISFQRGVCWAISLFSFWRALDSLSSLFALLKGGAGQLHVRAVDDGQPLGCPVRVAREVLVDAAVGLDGQHDEVAGLPVEALPVDNSVAFPFDGEEAQASLVAVLAGGGDAICR